MASSQPTEPQSSRALLLGLGRHLSQRRRIQLGLLLLVMLTSGAAELVSLGAVLPFLAALSDPERLWQQPMAQAVAGWFGFTRASQLVLPVSLAFATAAVVAAGIRLANLWLNGRVAAAIGSDLSCEAYRRTLLQPYSVHVQRNSSGVITTTMIHIDRTVQALGALLRFTSSAVVIIGLLTGLLLIDWVVALAAAGLFGGVYAVLSATARRELRQNSKRIASASTQQLKSLQEGLGAIRDVLLDSSQGLYLALYRQADRPKRLLQARNGFLGGFPKYLVEALGLVGIAILGGLLVLQQGSGGGVIPLLGAFALGAQRLLPALQQGYASWATLKNFNADMAAALAMLQQPVAVQPKAVDPLPFREALHFEAVHFRYGEGMPEVLKGVSLEIRRGERIGLIGSTGSGKSTTVDLLMGLLKPSCGRIVVDGDDLHDPDHPERLLSWRVTIAHVPQSIYLADCSIAENIAFGIPKQEIDLQRVRRAAEHAQIASFIESGTGGYDSIVGERGIRLSGGQRQRIGIARALYKDAKLLVLDEATSALDNSTEQAVTDAIESLSNDLTVVMIAHRLSTVERCDRVIRLELGVLVDDGPPSTVLSSNSL